MLDICVSKIPLAVKIAAEMQLPLNTKKVLGRTG